MGTEILINDTSQCVIKNENDLFKLVEQLQQDEKIPISQITFEGWPKYELTLRGEDFSGGIPTRIMPAFLELQKSVEHAYSMVVYGKSKRLSKYEKQRAEIIVHLEKGSTRFTVDLWNTLNSALQEAAKSMTGEQALIAILGVAAISGGTWSYKSWLWKKQDEKEEETKVKLSE